MRRIEHWMTVMEGDFYTGSFRSLKEFWEDKGKTGSFEKRYSIRLEGISQIVNGVREFLEGKLVLDMGCGPGVAASLFPTNAMVVGLDFSISMLKSAKGRILQLVRASAFNLPFCGEVFEAATCFFVMSDYSHKDGIFSEAYRVLRNKGFFMFADYSPMDEHWILKRGIRPIMGERCNIFIESKESLLNKMTQVGFRVQNAQYINFNSPFGLGWYIKSEKEMERLKETNLGLWKQVQCHMDNKKIRREFILLIGEK